MNFKNKIFLLYIKLRHFRFFNILLQVLFALEKKYQKEIKDSRQRVFMSLTNRLSVMNGPFKGLVYPNEELALSALPKIIGTYEKELVQIVNKIKTKQYQSIINIGSAEGYYAIGLAISMPESKILAFDIDEKARESLKALAEINRVTSRIQIEKSCNKDYLASLIKGKNALIISDCEGFEVELFHPSIKEYFENSDILIEAHDGFNRIISKTIIKIFKDTHQVTVIKQRKRTTNDFDLDLSISS